MKRPHSEVVRLQGQLLNLRLLGEIDAETFTALRDELRDRGDVAAKDRGVPSGRNETIDPAAKAFERSQNLREKRFTADYAAKRRTLEILCLNGNLVGVSLVPEMRKPFGLLAKGLLKTDSRGERI